jgi:hypothetical protein
LQLIHFQLASSRVKQNSWPKIVFYGIFNLPSQENRMKAGWEEVAICSLIATSPWKKIQDWLRQVSRAAAKG